MGKTRYVVIKIASISKKKINIYLNNKGNHYRDFTSINNVNIILDKLMKKKTHGNQVFNIYALESLFIF